MLLIPRRKLLKLGAASLLAAPAIIGKSNAQLMLTGIGGKGSASPVLTDLQLWFKGDELTGANNDPISTWTDASGHGRNATSVGVTRPLLATNFLNGKNVANSSAFGQGFTLPDLSAFGTTSGTLFMVVKSTADNSGGGSSAGPSYIGTGAVNVYGFSDFVVYNGEMSDTRKTTGDPTASGIHISNWQLLSIQSIASNWKLYFGSTQFFSTGTNTVAWAASAQLMGGGGGITWAGWMAEWMCYSPAIVAGSAAWTQNQSYLATKWGLTI